jgi:hypothetical protein
MIMMMRIRNESIKIDLIAIYLNQKIWNIK